MNPDQGNQLHHTTFTDNLVEDIKQAIWNIEDQLKDLDKRVKSLESENDAHYKIETDIKQRIDDVEHDLAQRPTEAKLDWVKHDVKELRKHVDTALHKASTDLTDISVDLNQTIDDTLATDEEGRLLQYLSENANDTQEEE